MRRFQVALTSFTT